MFEPQRRADNKQWKRKDQKRPCIVKRSISLKKMLYAIFFNASGPVAQVPCPSGHTVTGWFYKNSVLKKVKEFYNKKRPRKGWSGLHLLHDNASSHKCEVVKSFLASEKVKVLNHPPYSPDLNPCDFFLFPWLKKRLSGNKYTSRSSLGSAIYQCLQLIPNEDYLSAFHNWVKRLQKMCFSRGGILWRFVIKICLIKCSPEAIGTQWQNFLQDPRRGLHRPWASQPWLLVGSWWDRCSPWPLLLLWHLLSIFFQHLTFWLELEILEGPEMQHSPCWLLD